MGPRVSKREPLMPSDDTPALAPEALAQGVLDLFERAVGDPLTRMRAALATMLPLSAHPPAGTGAAPRWRHRKRGTHYTELGRAEAQVATRAIEEGDLVVVYRGDDGVLAVRRADEFEDGRFERLSG